MIPFLLLRFILSITNDTPTTVEIYLIYYEWFPYYCWDLPYLLRMIPYYCWDLSYLLRMIPLLLLRFILSITNDSPTTVEIYLIYYEWFPYYCWDLSYLLRMIPLLLLRFIWSIANDSPNTVEIYLIYYEWFPYYCWDLSDLLRMIPLLLLRFIWSITKDSFLLLRLLNDSPILSITNDSPTTVEIYLIYYEWFPYYCWDLSYLLRMIPYYCRDLSDLLRMITLLLLWFILSIRNDSPTNV